MSRLGIFLFFTIAAYAHATVPVNDAQDAVKAVLLRQNRLPIMLSDVKGKSLCKDCEKLALTLKKVVQNPLTQQELEHTLNSVCSYPLLSSYKGRCLNAMNNLVVILHELQWLLDDPSNFCEMINMCKNEAASVNSVGKRLALSVAAKIVQDIHEPVSAYKVDNCKVCEDTIEAVKDLLQIGDLEQEIQNALELICKYTGNPSQCKEVIEYEFPKVMGSIINLLSQNDKLCCAMTLCKAPNETDFETLALPQREGPHLNRLLTKVRGLNMGCRICEAAVKEAVKSLDQPKVLKTMSTDITNVVCKLLPKSLQAGCFDFLNIYAIAALELTFSDIDPEKVCQDMHACNASFSQQMELLSYKPVLVCDACMILTSVVAAELEDPSVQKEIMGEMSKGCNKITCGLDKTCNDWVAQTVPKLLTFVAEFLKKADACTKLHLC